MSTRYAVRLAALALLVTAAGCGGGGDGGEPAPSFQETRTFDFSVTVPGTSSPLSNVAFFRDSGLTQPGVTLASASNPTLARTTGSVTGQDAVSGAGSDFAMAVHFDASGSIDDNGRDPGGLRFDAADVAIAEVGQRRPTTDVRVYAFRSTYPNAFKQVAGPFDASNAGARTSAIGAAQAEGADRNSPALTATYNIIGDGGGDNGSLPSGQPHAMLLLTDGENNAEDPAIAPHTACSGAEGGAGGCSSNIGNVVNRANSRDTKVFVAALGNVESELEKFRRLADETGGGFVKVTRAEELGRQFRNLGALMTDGGVVVQGRTGEVTVNVGGNPFVRGWMRFDEVDGACPGGALSHDGSTCKLEF